MALNAGSLTTIAGPMFSGKSTELARITRRQKIVGKKCLVVKFHRDTRYGNQLRNHDGVVYDFCDIVHADHLAAVNINSYDVIGIDEGQFFPDIMLANDWATAGKIVIVSGLNLSYKLQPFTAFCNLCALAEFHIKLTAVCGCGAEAIYTWLCGSQPADGILIGNESNGYKAVCRECYNRHIAFSANALPMEM